MSTIELTNKVRELKELKAMAEELHAEITAIEDTIKEEMTTRDTEQMTVDIFKVRWTTVKSNRFDTTGFKKVYADPISIYQRKRYTPLQRSIGGG